MYKKRTIATLLIALFMISTLAVAVSVQGVLAPGMAGGTIEVVSLDLSHLADEELFNAEPETLVLGDIPFDGQHSTVTMEGTLSDLHLSKDDKGAWPDTAYVNIGMRPEADKDRANAGVWFFVAATGAGGSPYELYKAQLEDYTGQCEDPATILMPRGLGDYRYKVTFKPDTGTLIG
ncbi:unnamed protein product, partial [marine sediment metagenome]